LQPNLLQIERTPAIFGFFASQKHMAAIFEKFVAYHTSGVQLNSTPHNVHMQRVTVMAKSPQEVMYLGGGN
jgi:hypothetical protein